MSGSGPATARAAVTEGSIRAAVLLAVMALLPAEAAALEPWTAPDIARPCPHLGPGFIAVPGSRTCVRIGGRVTADFGSSARALPRRPDREGLNGLHPHVQVRVEARTETDIGDLTLVYQTDPPGRRTLGR